MIHTRLRSPTEECLTPLGWQRLDGALPLFQLGENSQVRLAPIAVLGGGTRYRLDAPAFAPPDAAAHLAANAALPGPLKFAQDAGGEVACVADLPSAVLAAAGEFDSAAAESPIAAWAECLTALAGGHPLTNVEAVAPGQLTKTLETAGYTASVDGSGVKATLVLPGRFVEVSIEPGEPGLALSFALSSGAASPEAAAAARKLAAEVNRRLLLARVSEQESGVLIAEVRLTMARVHAAWLLAAMESLSAAAELALRPLAALADPALAAHVMGL